MISDCRLNHQTGDRFTIFNLKSSISNIGQRPMPTRPGSPIFNLKSAIFNFRQLEVQLNLQSDNQSAIFNIGQLDPQPNLQSDIFNLQFYLSPRLKVSSTASVVAHLATPIACMNISTANAASSIPRTLINIREPLIPRIRSSGVENRSMR